MTRENIIEKVKKLLALAKSDNANEAYLAMTRAQEIQAKYNIRVTEIEEKEETVIDITVSPEDTKSTTSAYLYLGSHLAKHFRVEVYKSRAGLGIIGLSQDVEVFQEVFRFVYAALRNISARFVKSLPSCMDRSTKTAEKNLYIRGFITGAGESLELNEAEHALVVVTPQSVTQYKDKKCNGVWRSSAKMSHNAATYNAGYQDGMAVTRNHKKQIA